MAPRPPDAGCLGAPPGGATTASGTFKFCVGFPGSATPAAATADPGACVAPSPGTVRQLHVAVGDAVTAGDALVTLETMKVEQTLRAAQAGTVRAVRAKVDEAVAEGALLVDLEVDDAEA